MEVDDRGFLASLKKAVEDLRKRSERNLDSLGEVTLRAAESKVPVKTGRLKRSFHKQSRRSLGGFEVVVSNDAPYAAHVELGTSDTPPHPFMRPAQDRARGAAAAVLRRN